MYYIGIDGGGSFSRLVAIDADKCIIGRIEGASTNIASMGYGGVLENIGSLIAEFNSVSGTTLADCGGICIGTAGVGIPEHSRSVTHIFRQIGFDGKLKVITDGELVLLAETKGQPGAAVISGTGSIAYAMDKHGNTLRAGGWGHLIDDGGSGYGIGIDAIKCALMDFDGRGEKTMITSLVDRHFGLNGEIGGVLKYIYAPDFTKARIAEVALLVKQAYEKGDNVAVQILDRAAANLTALATTLIKRAGLDEHKLVISGSVLLKSDFIRDKFNEGIVKYYPKMQIVQPSEKPEMGAAILATKL